MKSRERQITEVTLIGSIVNMVLSVFKILAGVFGASAAMIADGVHSLSDLASDIVVLIFVRISSKGKDESHEYGHGKFETMATLIVSLILIIVAVELMLSGIGSIRTVIGGGVLPSPKYIALAAAVISIVSKEILYRYTVIVGRKVDSPAVIANAWHHRSDAFSSVGSLIGIAGALFLGDKWTILDPLASCVISIAVFAVALKMTLPSFRELMEVALPEDVQKDIIATASSVRGVEDVHGLKTRRNGPSIIIDAHIVVRPDMNIVDAHDIATNVENALKGRFGNETQISIHIEPDIDSE